MAYSVINKPSDYFNTKLYSASGSGQSITGVGFQPDWTWIKARSDGGGHALYDSVRGTTKRLASHNTNAEGTVSGGVTAFDADGFTVGNDGDVNSASSIVSWNWLGANGTSANTDGSISSTVSANTTSGFSIVSYTGNGTDNATVGHGLSQKPDMVIIKARENTSSWLTWHKDLTGAGYAVFLDGTDAQANYNILKNQSSSVLTLSTNSAVNANTQGFISYNFHSVQGYSKFGSYTGNGNADGTFVYTGFKPAFVMFKNANNGSEAWEIFDTKRDTFNTSYKGLFPDSVSAEATNTSQNIDILSNGFKCRSAETRFNGSGNTIIYMAFAEEPLVGDNPATAR
jgi:hypothetical protein